ncbi:MAG TPA: type II toxin-antitoxin system VapC family toxin, partial [Fibrella sp.]
MKLLLDTQILIWFQLNDPQLPRRIRLLIEDPANEVVISQLSFIEITIKQVTNRLPTFTVLTEELANTAETDGFVILPVSLNHVIAYRQIHFYA